MKCLILCGGRGVIDPVSNLRVPKALLRIGNRPLVWHVMKLFASYGYTEFVLSLGLGGEQIKEYFIHSFELLHDIEVNLAGNKVTSLNKIPEENWTIKLVDTGISANTGARIARCERFLKHESFFIAYSDVLADVNLDKLSEYHQKAGKILTVTGVNPPSRFGTFHLANNDVKGYDPAAKLDMNTSKLNGGFMIANKEIFQYLSPISECNLEMEVFQTLVEKQEMALWQHSGFWQNVDTERDMVELQKLYEVNKRPWLGIN